MRTDKHWDNQDCRVGAALGFAELGGGRLRQIASAGAK